MRVETFDDFERVLKLMDAHFLTEVQVGDVRIVKGAWPQPAQPADADLLTADGPLEDASDGPDVAYTDDEKFWSAD